MAMLIFHDPFSKAASISLAKKKKKKKKKKKFSLKSSIRAFDSNYYRSTSNFSIINQ